MVDRDAGRSRRIGRPDAWQELPGRPARPIDETTRDGPGPGRGRALHPGVGLLDAETRRALPRPRSRLAHPPQRSSPHPTSSGTARTPRPHGDHQPSRLNTALPKRRVTCPTVPRHARWSGIHGSVWDLEALELERVRRTAVPAV